MMTIEQARENIGRNVTYERYYGDLMVSGPEFGVITSVNDRYVFVRYGAQVGSKATDPADLTLDHP